MKRVALCLILGLAAGFAAWPARAECADEIRALKAKLITVKDDARRQELLKLAEKAEKDDKAGRAKLCDQAVQHANALLK